MDRSIRFLAEDPNLTLEQARLIARELVNGRDGIDEGLLVSVAKQQGGSTVMATFSSSDSKKRAMSKAQDGKSLLVLTPPVAGMLDGTFQGVTILHDSPDSAVDICAVHGLNGNAVGTWTAKNGKMWLRDSLPQEPPFNQSRVMTYGYNSILLDSKRFNDRLTDYADDLIKRICWERRTEAERSRPLILVCHSMGGLVGRLAMARLKTLPDSFPALRLSQCGLLFLSTPHMGSTLADSILVNVAKAVGARKNIISELRSFNPSSGDCAEVFQTMHENERPPFACLCEGSPTVFAGGTMSRLVVEQASAGFLGRPAVKILGRDHNTICKFENRWGDFNFVKDELLKIRAELRNRLVVDQVAQIHYAGKPMLMPNRFPVDPEHLLYLGRGLRRDNSAKIIGRKEIVSKLLSLSSYDGSPSSSRPGQRLVALEGIGGIGKTEILLEIAAQRRGLSNVFFLDASNKASLNRTLSNMAEDVGEESLYDQIPTASLHDRWGQLSEAARTRAFQTWLGSDTNRDSLIVLDDLDSSQSDDAVRDYLPSESNVIICSTRNGTLSKSRSLNIEPLFIPAMDRNELKDLLAQEFSFIDVEPTESELDCIAGIVNGHPLAACRAATFVSELSLEGHDNPAQTFIESFQNQDYALRYNYLHHRANSRASIFECFESSMIRLDETIATDATQLLGLMGFLCGLEFDEPPIAYSQFLQERPWLREFEKDLPDCGFLAGGVKGKGRLLWGMLKVGLGFRRRLNDTLRFHNLWVECIRQWCGPERSTLWLNQILFICHESGKRGGNQEVLTTVAQNCYKIAHSFQLRLDQYQF